MVRIFRRLDNHADTRLKGITSYHSQSVIYSEFNDTTLKLIIFNLSLTWMFSVPGGQLLKVLNLNLWGLGWPLGEDKDLR
jgi:hypothetical protein